MDYTLEEEFLKKFLLQLKLLFMPFEGNNFSPKFLQSKILLYCVVCLLILKIFISLISLNLPQNIFFADITRTALTNFVNQGREAAGLNSLSENKMLDQAALLKAEDMIKNNYFSHESPGGITPWHWFKITGYNYKYAAENLAIGFLDSKDVYNAWYNSVSHKDNMLNPNYKEFGTAVLTGNFNGNNATIVVQLFASPLTLNIPASNKEVMPTAEYKFLIENLGTISDNQPNESNTIISKEVLSQFSEYPILKATGENNGNAFYLQFLNFIFYRYEEIAQSIIYSILILVALASLINILVHFNIQNRGLILRSLLLISLLLVSAFLDRNIIAMIVPHKIII
ncbi:MAG: CAP domain-containing protein [Patescibacteria group bacterium]